MHTHSAPKRIVVMDDEPDILEFLQILLQEEGFEVITVSNRRAFFDLVQGGRHPDLFLLDVFLSGADGREIVASLKSKQETRSIPVLMFSAHPHIEQSARQAGADDFLAKPFDMDVLLSKVLLLLN